jgi:hypothetical protein
MPCLRSIAVVACFSSLALAAEDRVTYERDVRPIFRKHCVGCHQQDNVADRDVSGGLALDGFERVIAGVQQSPPRVVVVPGQSDESRLLTMLLTPIPCRRNRST